MPENSSQSISVPSTNPTGTNTPIVAQNDLLVWLNANATTSNDDSRRKLEQFQSVINDVKSFTQPDECFAFLESIQLTKTFVVVSGSLGQHFVSFVHHMPQVAAIYIFCVDRSQHDKWAREWPKVKGIHTQIETLYTVLELAFSQRAQDTGAVSFVPVSKEASSALNLNQLEPSFMYTQLLKKSLLNMEHDWKKALRDFVNYSHGRNADSSIQLPLIDEFGRDYLPSKAIWWYTRETFIYKMLNQALRLLEADIIVGMGFFIYDLHQQIQRLHDEQVGSYAGKTFEVYRGQGLSISKFEKLKKTRGGLISFDCFLSTSTKKRISINFAETAAANKDTVGILFIMTIDPNITVSPFADIQNSSYFKNEAEIIFAMHTVFRIDNIKSMGEGRRYFEVKLTLTTDDDTQLRTLTQQLQNEGHAPNGWERMGRLLIKLKLPNKAEELYNTLLEKTSNPDDQGRYYHQLGCIKNQQGKPKEALFNYERAVEISRRIFPEDNPLFATYYTNIGSVYQNMGDYSKAMSAFEKSLEIRQKSCRADGPGLATSNNNIGFLYVKMRDYSTALAFLGKALEIRQECLNAHHPDLATSYSNIGSVYSMVGQYSIALAYYEQATLSRERSLAGNHPDLAASYKNIGSIYSKMEEHVKALPAYERAIEIYQKKLPAYRPHLESVLRDVQRTEMKLGDK